MAQRSSTPRRTGSARAGGSHDPDRERHGVELRLVNGFEVLCAGEPVELPLTAQRVVAFLALQERPVQRVYVAGKLWLETLEERASHNLRSAIWRVKQTKIPLIRTPDTRLALDPSVRVDLSEVVGLAHTLIRERDDVDLWSCDLSTLTGEILPDWYDDWLVIEREAHRQLCLHALEELAARLTVAARYGEAVEVALSAVAGEPLRESAHRALIRVYLAEGNTSEALRHADLYRALLRTHLGLCPSSQLDALVAGLTPG